MVAESFVLGVIIVLSLIISHKISNPRWEISKRVEYKKLVRILGNPNFSNTNPKGLAIWNKICDKIPFSRVMLIDEQIVQYVPYKHNGFLYVSIKYEIDEKDLESVLSISCALMYDKLKKVLTIRSDSLNHAMSWLILAHDVIKKQVDLPLSKEQIKQRLQTSCGSSSNNYNRLINIKAEYNLKSCSGRLPY